MGLKTTVNRRILNGNVEARLASGPGFESRTPARGSLRSCGGCPGARSRCNVATMPAETLAGCRSASKPPAGPPDEPMSGRCGERPVRPLHETSERCLPDPSARRVRRRHADPLGSGSWHLGQDVFLTCRGFRGGQARAVRSCAQTGHVRQETARWRHPGLDRRIPSPRCHSGTCPVPLHLQLSVASAPRWGEFRHCPLAVAAVRSVQPVACFDVEQVDPVRIGRQEDRLTRGK